MEVSSAPYPIDPIEFDLSDTKKNQKKLQELKTMSARVVGNYNGLELVEYQKTPKETFIVAEVDGEIAYMVHLKTMKFKALPAPSVTQVEVWRTAFHDTLLRGLPSYVFEKLLLSSNKYIVSDSAQSEAGKRFWMGRMDDAVRKGHHVGVFDVDEAEVVWATNPKDFKDFITIQEHKAWGKVFNKHEYLRFVIKA